MRRVLIIAMILIVGGMAGYVGGLAARFYTMARADIIPLNDAPPREIQRRECWKGRDILERGK